MLSEAPTEDLARCNLEHNVSWSPKGSRHPFINAGVVGNGRPGCKKLRQLGMTSQTVKGYPMNSMCRLSKDSLFQN